MKALQVTHDHKVVDAIANHPSVRPFIGFTEGGELNSALLLATDGVVALFGRHGGFVFIPSAPGTYEVHGATLPEGRGPWTRMAFREALDWMFRNTQAQLIEAHIPKGNFPAQALAYLGGFSFVDDENVETRLYRLTRREKCL